MISKKIYRKYCLATVSSENFLQGALVMIYSFLKHNPWFDGDIVIIHDELPEQYQVLFGDFKNVRFLQASDFVKDKVNLLCQGAPHLKLEKKKQRFYSLEFLRLSKYHKVLFCDSDILFIGNIFELMNTFNNNSEKALIKAGGDLYYFTDSPVSEETFMPVTKVEKNKPVIRNTYNSGFLLVDKIFLSDYHYQQMLNLLNIDRWQKIKAPRTDQILFNLYFKNSFELISVRYNYLVMHADVIPLKEKILPGEIKVMHFNGRVKPWDFVETIKGVNRNFSLLRFVDMWYKVYTEFLHQSHLKHKFLYTKQQLHVHGKVNME